MSVYALSPTKTMLVSPVFTADGTEVCLDFLYYISGTYLDALRVYVKKISDSFFLLISKLGEQNGKWTEASHTLGIVDKDFQVSL